MHRYKMPMEQLQQFANTGNEHWFRQRDKYWYNEANYRHVCSTLIQRHG
jgi:hypothetical protein